jgi:predicted O-linked N-acetylglucosamine transferase (SPINDLY family)
MTPTPADQPLDYARRLLEAKRYADAAAVCRGLLARSPELADAHELLGDALEHQGRSAGAEASYRESLRLQPDRPESLWGLSCALRSQKEFAAAVPFLRRLVELTPDDFVGWHNLGTTLHELGRTDDALDALAESVKLNGFTAGMSRAATATIISGSPRSDNAAVLAARRAFAADLPHTPAPPPPGVPDRPVRLGYVSSFFMDRNWMKPVWGVINRHDRGRFEVHLFSEGPADAITHGYRPDPRDHFHDFRGQPNELVADRIRAAGIDVLVDLNGYSRAPRLPLYALRPAAVQLGWFNLYATSGVPGIDHLLGDADVIPPAEEPHYSERIIRLPRCYLTYEVTYPVPDVTPPPCLKNQAITFGCLAPQYKITPPLLDAWARILAAAPTSRLVLKGTFLGRPRNAEWLRHEFTAREVSAERVELGGPAEHFTFLQKYADIDVALDSFPYNGGTTTMEALWQGVPVVCFTGDRWGARIGASMMRSAGLPEFVAADVEGYVNLAVQLAIDPTTPAKLKELRETMREWVRASRLGDVEAFTRELEKVYLGLLG